MGFRLFCPCTFRGVDLLTVTDAPTLDGWQKHASHGWTVTCPRCELSWALTSALERRLVPHPQFSAALGEGPVRVTTWLRRPAEALACAA